MKRKTILVVLLALAVIVLIVFETAQPGRINWTESLTKDDRIPFGTYILYHELDELFPEQEIIPYKEPLRDLEDETRPYYDYTGNEQTLTSGHERFNYIYFHKSNDFAGYGTKQLMRMMRSGANVFLASSKLNYKLEDSLGVQMDIDPKEDAPYNKRDDAAYMKRFRKKETTIRMTEQAESPDKVTYNRFTVQAYIKYVDEDDGWQILAKNAEDRPVLIRKPLGKGQVIVCSTPLLFTNFNMLIDERAKLAFAMLSYLPVQTTYWDNYFRDSRQQSQSQLRAVLASAPLKWSYITGLSALFLAAFFLWKRRQRLIPIIEPPENTTVQYAETIGRLYFQHGDHKNIADKRIDSLLAYIREHFYLRTNSLSDPDFAKRLHDKTGFDTDKIAQLLQMIKQVSYQAEITEAALVRLTSLIEDFYEHTRVTAKQN